MSDAQSDEIDIKAFREALGKFASGVPVIENSLTWFDCLQKNKVEVADHITVSKIAIRIWRILGQMLKTRLVFKRNSGLFVGQTMRGKQ